MAHVTSEKSAWAHRSVRQTRKFEQIVLTLIAKLVRILLDNGKRMRLSGTKPLASSG